MCIRDSPRSLSPSELRAKDFSHTILTSNWHGNQREIKTHCELISTCLLYTSDAADERSSVDLGGRRIIKKKNKHSNIKKKKEKKKNNDSTDTICT